MSTFVVYIMFHLNDTKLFWRILAKSEKSPHFYWALWHLFSTECNFVTLVLHRRCWCYFVAFVLQQLHCWCYLVALVLHLHCWCYFVVQTRSLCETPARCCPARAAWTLRRGWRQSNRRQRVESEESSNDEWVPSIFVVVNSWTDYALIVVANFMTYRYSHAWRCAFGVNCR